MASPTSSVSGDGVSSVLCSLSVLFLSKVGSHLEGHSEQTQGRMRLDAESHQQKHKTSHKETEAKTDEATVAVEHPGSTT